MNINDLRANAYTKNAGKPSSQGNSNTSNVSSTGKNIKPFVPVQLTKNDSQVSQNSQTPQGSFVQANIVSMTNTKKTNIPESKESEKTYNDYDNILFKVPATSPTEDGKESVYRRIAKFLILIGDDQASKILPLLPENSIEKIIPEIASIRTINNEEAAAILNEFKNLLNKDHQTGGIDTAKDILERAYGTKKADEMLRKALPLEGRKPFSYLNEADNEKIYNLIKDENDGMKALVLSHIEAKKAAEIINKMGDEEKKAVVLRLAKMEKMQPDLIVQLDKVLYEKSLKYVTEETININGMNALSQILRKMDSGAEAAILNNLSDDDPELTADLKSRLFTVDDVIDVEDRIIQEKLRDMSDDDICYLLAGKNEEFRCKLLDNISAGRRSDIFKQEAILKPMRKSDVEKTTSHFLNSIRDQLLQAC